MIAQDAMREHIRGCSMVLMIATLLHSIAVGNCLPSNVKTVCVDINPAHLTKLIDRVPPRRSASSRMRAHSSPCSPGKPTPERREEVRNFIFLFCSVLVNVQG